MDIEKLRVWARRGVGAAVILERQAMLNGGQMDLRKNKKNYQITMHNAKEEEEEEEEETNKTKSDAMKSNSNRMNAAAAASAAASLSGFRITKTQPQVSHRHVLGLFVSCCTQVAVTKATTTTTTNGSTRTCAYSCPHPALADCCDCCLIKKLQSQSPQMN